MHIYDTLCPHAQKAQPLSKQECNGTIDERAAFSGNRAIIFREPGSHFPGTGEVVSRVFEFPE